MKTQQTYRDGSPEAAARRERLDNARMTGFSNAPDEPAKPDQAPRKRNLGRELGFTGKPDPQGPATAGASHSPLPWTVTRNGNKPPKIVNSGKPGFIAILGFPNEGDREANAAFIVRACNNAQRLADALADIIEQFDKTKLMVGADLSDSIRVFGKQALAQWEQDK